MQTRLLIVTVAVVMLGFAPAPFPKRKAVQGDLKAMQGTWVYHSSRAWGGVLANDTVLTISGNRLRWFCAGKADMNSIALGSSGGRRIIDITQDGQATARLGIYKLEGDTLTVCDDLPGRPRPKEFDGEKHLLVVYKRKKP